MCPGCHRRLARRAAWIGRWVALATTVPLAVYVTVTLPSRGEARLVGAVAVVIWYVLTSLVARRIAWEWMQ
jgi:hypothetical protein